MSKILYLHQYFKTPSEAGASRSYFLAKAMVEAGHQVTIITQGDFKKVEIIDGIKVIYLENQYSNKMGVLKRIRAYFQFYFSAKNTAKQLEFDFIYATSTPLLVGWLGRKLAIKRKVQYFFEVRDLWPDFPIQAGVLPFPFSWMLRRMERLIYRDAQKIVTCSKGIYETVCQRTIPGKVIVASNFSPFPKVEIEPNGQNLIYFGSLGRYNGIELWRPFLERLKEMNTGAQWFVVGEGAQESLVKELSKEFPFIHLVKPMPRNELLSFIREKNIRYSWVTFSKLPVLQTNSPNKLFDSWQFGLIPIINQIGWMKEWADEYGAVFYDHTNTDQTIQQLLKINYFEPELQKFQSGTSKASAYFHSSKSISEVIDVIPNQSQFHRQKWAVISTVHPPYDQRLSQRIPELISSQYLVYYLGKGRGLPHLSSPIARVFFFYPYILFWIFWHRIKGVHLADPELLPLGIILKKLGFEVIWDVHEDFEEQFFLKKGSNAIYLKWIARWEKKLLNRGARLMVTEKYYAELGRYKDFVPTIIPNFPSSYPFKQISHLFDEESLYPKFIYVGIINEHRGMFELFQAWKNVKLVFPNAELILVGRSNLDIPAEITHLEGQWLEVATSISGAWAGISFIKKTNPITHYPLQSFPTKIGEYAALGLPVICNLTPIHSEFLENSGVFLQEISVEEMTSAFIDFIRDEQKRANLKQSALLKRSRIQNNSTNLSKSSELYQL
jgi:glycosyltransferase involved in cell wall biosynthesis